MNSLCLSLSCILDSVARRGLDLNCHVWWSQVSAKTELSSQNLSPLVPKTCLSECYTHALAVEMYMSRVLLHPPWPSHVKLTHPAKKSSFRDIYTFAYHPLPAFVPSQKDPRFCPPYFKTCCIMHEPKRLQTSINHINTSCLAPVTVTQMGRFYATSGANDHNEKPPLQCLEGQIWIILIFHVGYGWSEVVAIIIFSSERESVVPAEGKRVNQASFHNRE